MKLNVLLMMDLLIYIMNNSFTCAALIFIRNYEKTKGRHEF